MELYRMHVMMKRTRETLMEPKINVKLKIDHNVMFQKKNMDNSIAGLCIALFYGVVLCALTMTKCEYVSAIKSDSTRVF